MCVVIAAKETSLGDARAHTLAFPMVSPSGRDRQILKKIFRLNPRKFTVTFWKSTLINSNNITFVKLCGSAAWCGHRAQCAGYRAKESLPINNVYI